MCPLIHRGSDKDMYAPAVDYLKLAIGEDIVCRVNAIFEQKSNQYDGFDYRVEGDVGDRLVSFYVFGATMIRQCTDHLGLSTPMELTDRVVRFRMKPNRAAKGRHYVDIDFVNGELGVFVGGSRVDAAVGTTPTRSAHSPRRAGSAPHTARSSTAQAGNGSVARPELLAARQAEAQIPTVVPPDANIIAASQFAGRMYAAAFRNARTVAALPQNSDLEFGPDVLHTMAATIMIEAGKVLRRDRF